MGGGEGEKVIYYLYISSYISITYCLFSLVPDVEKDEEKGHRSINENGSRFRSECRVLPCAYCFTRAMKMMTSAGRAGKVSAANPKADMTANKYYQEFMSAKIQGAITDAKAASMLTHQGVKGTVLEILVARLFRPLLPSDLGVGTGQIIDQQGRISNQIDIILYDRSILPPALYDDRTGLFPIEAVLYSIEVKTTLTRADIVQAHTAAKKISEFTYLPGLFNPDGSAQQHHIDRVRSAVFALSSDAQMRESDRYASVYAQINDSPLIAAICVAGKEYTYDDSRRWVIQPATGQCDEILSFLGGVMNTYKRIAASRHRPLLGHYIIPTAPVEYGPATGHNGLVSARCEVCQGISDMAPRIPQMGQVVVTGGINFTSPGCPHCGGEMRASPAVYTFRNGELRGVAELPIPASGEGAAG